MNIMKQILETYPFRVGEKFGESQVYIGERDLCEVRLVVLDEEPVYAENLAAFSPSPELIIFLSRHSSESAIPTLSVHVPGNLGEARLGGSPRKVSVAPANAMRTALRAMAKLVAEKHLNYKVSYECTHHGPSLNKPTMFIELGSSPKQWVDTEAAKVIAKAVMETVSSFRKNETQAVLGIGGPHYNEKFTEIAIRGELAFGHIIPKYALWEVDEDILKQCVERTLEKVEWAVLDWKGIRGEDKQRLVKMLERIGLKIQKV
ncbi:MAG: D-aminoacyl-tRNA deacylase [Candidatus Bathyarchaeia archaeon]